MTVLLAAFAAAIAAVVYWAIAADAAGRRRLTIGTMPAVLPALVALVAGAACATGVHLAAIGALAGVAVAAWVDARTGSIFDPLTLTLFMTSLGLCWFDGTPAAGAYGAAGVGAALLLLHAVTDGNGLGLGDVKLGAALGMALGPACGLTAIGFAFIFGGAYGAWLLITKRASSESAVRFGPFIAAGTVVALFVPSPIVP
jgi:prepilin signal peptidase PulO-like enzyme (type II secretory pathway)